MKSKGTEKKNEYIEKWANKISKMTGEPSKQTKKSLRNQ